MTITRLSVYRLRRWDQTPGSGWIVADGGYLTGGLYRRFSTWREAIDYAMRRTAR